MKMKILAISALLISLSAISAFSADVLLDFAIQQAMSQPKVSAQFPGDIAFYWGNQGHPGVARNYGNFKTSKRTNALGKSREDACAWALASALEALQERARKEGGNAVINIVSNIKNYENSSETSYQCLAGSVMVNVALKGDVVKLAK